LRAEPVKRTPRGKRRPFERRAFGTAAAAAREQPHHDNEHHRPHSVIIKLTGESGHCSPCRKHSGSFGGTQGRVPREAFHLLGGVEPIRPPDRTTAA
jgi:hypothetical protein